MTLGAEIQGGAVGTQYPVMTRPVSVLSNWVTAIDVGGMTVTDNSTATVVNPGAVSASTRHLINVKESARGAPGSICTSALFRMSYASGLTGITSPVIQVFGKDLNGVWMALPNRNGDFTFALSAATGDVDDTTDKKTQVSVLTTTVDLLGCAEFLTTIKTALAGTGTTSTAYAQCKLI